MTYPTGPVRRETTTFGPQDPPSEPWRDTVAQGVLTVGAIVGPLLAAFGLFVRSTPRELPDVLLLAPIGVLLPALPLARRLAIQRRAAAAIVMTFGAAIYLIARAGFAAGSNAVLISASVLGAAALLGILFARIVNFVIRHADANLRATAAALEELRGANEAQRVLAELGAVLSPLRYDSSLEDVAPLVARHLADVVIFFVTQPDGELHRVAAATRDSAQAWIAEAVMTSLRATVRADHPARQVVRDRQPFIRQYAPESLEHAAENPEHLRVLRAMYLRSALVVPLSVGETCHGALGLASSSHAFDETDLPLALEIGRRCALFIESARLHRSEKAAIKARDEVLAIVAHDVRNHLANMTMQLALFRRPPGLPERRSMEVAEALEHGVRRMSRILQDLLDVTKLESGRFQFNRTEVSPGELIAEVSRWHRREVVARSLELRTEVSPDLPAVWADGSRIVQVFENLIGNATKFTSAGSITLGARLPVGAKGKAGDVVFWVADTGVGIAMEDIAHVFDRYWQARRFQHGGVGLGLTIVRQIVQAHGGRLWVDSELGAGSTFFFTLPTAGTPAKAP